MDTRFTFSDSHGVCPRNRSGYNFFHETVLTDNETGRTWTAKIRYGNRTWEPWPFYTVHQSAVAMAKKDLEDDAVKKAIQERTRMHLKPVKRITREYRRKAIEFYGDGIALATLSNVKC